MMGFKTVFSLFCDCWKLYSKYAVTDLLNADLQQCIEESQELYHNKYAAEVLAKDLIKAVIYEIGEIEKMKRRNEHDAGDGNDK